VELRADDRDEDVMMLLRGSVDGQIEKLAEDCLSQLPGVVSVAIEPESDSWCEGESEESHQGRRSQRPGRPSAATRVYGKPRLAYKVGDFRYEISPGSFFQSARSLLPEFVDTVTGGDQQAGSLAIDLYAGVGLFTLPLGRRFKQVVAVEENSMAAADLTRNSTAHELGNVHAVATPAAEFLRRYAQAAPALVVLDPPRAGAEGSVLRRIAELAPGRIHYASCNPPTLARDLAYLLSRGYQLESLEFFDFFPQTFHLETVAKLGRTQGSG
jgi:23S rRNA (uracil1939-C5)-methyltransferase